MDDDETVENGMPITLGRSTWAIRGDALPRLVEAHRAGRASGRVLERLAVRAAAATPKAARRQAAARAGGAVAVIPLTGVITPRGSFLSMLFGGGGGGLIDFRDTFRQAVADPDVGAIVIDIDSPGGLVDLVPETAAEIRAARGEKPIISVANTMAASAAYWIGSQGDEFVVTPSGDVGSVGVYMVHEDWSGFNAGDGHRPDLHQRRPLQDRRQPRRAALRRGARRLAAGGRRPLRDVRRRRSPPAAACPKPPSATVTARAAHCSPSARSPPGWSTGSTRSRR
jgi:hypothetical protein